MKNQWFGDMYDFRKYGLLLFLAKYYSKIHVCWMLTKNDDYSHDIQKDVWLEEFFPKQMAVLHAALEQTREQVINQYKQTAV